MEDWVKSEVSKQFEDMDQKEFTEFIKWCIDKWQMKEEIFFD